MIIECVVCSQIKFTKSSLCKFCWKKFLAQREVLKVKHYSVERIPHFYLLNWSESSDSFVRPLIYHLKGRGPNHFEEWAMFFVELSDILQGCQIFAPCSSGKYQKNQALSFGQSFAKLCSLPGVKEVGTRKERVKEMKSLNLIDRRRKVLEEEPTVRACCPWIFIDDILVTGSTLDSLRYQLGDPSFIVTLFYRPLGKRV